MIDSRYPGMGSDNLPSMAQVRYMNVDVYNPMRATMEEVPGGGGLVYWNRTELTDGDELTYHSYERSAMYENVVEQAQLLALAMDAINDLLRIYEVHLQGDGFRRRRN